MLKILNIVDWRVKAKRLKAKDVGEFLKNHDDGVLNKYAKVFMDNDIDGAQLLNLIENETYALWDHLNVMFPHRHKIKVHFESYCMTL